MSVSTRALHMTCKSLCLVATFVFVSCFSHAFAKEQEDSILAWDLVLSDAVQQEAHRISAEARRRRQAIHTVNELQEFRNHVRRGLLNVLFEQTELPPTNQPLPVRMSGRPRTLTECTVYNLSYESIPGHWVPANLYVPKDVTFPVPGILCVADHSEEGKAAPYNQRQGRAFAERGYVALVIDYPDRGELLGGNDHFINGTQIALTGLWSNSLFVTNALRGIDYMVSRSDLVDSAHIGITGTSGGGATTAIVAALDERVVAAVPCCFLESFERAIDSTYTSCPEYFAPGGIVWPMEWSDILTVAIPRAVAPITALEDSLFTQEGFDEGVNQAKAFYTISGIPVRLRVVRTREKHSYSPAMREAAFFWFAQWLGAPKGDQLPEWDNRVREVEDVHFTIADDRLELMSAEDLAVNIPSATNLHTIALARSKRLRQKRYEFRTGDFGKQDADNICDRVKNFFHPATDLGDLKVETLSTQQTTQGTVEEIVLESPKLGVRLPACWAQPSDNRPQQLLLYLNDGGRSNLEADEIAVYLEHHTAVLAVDLRGMGQLYPRASDWDRYPWCDISRLLTYGLWSLNSSVPHLQITDTQLGLNFLIDRSNSGQIPIYILGVGRAAPIALFTTAIRSEITGLLGQGSLVSYENYLEHESPTHNQMSLSYGVLKEFDLPEVLAAVADRLLCWSDIVDASGKRLSPKKIQGDLPLMYSLVKRPEFALESISTMEIAQLLGNHHD